MKTCMPSHRRRDHVSETCFRESDHIEQPFDAPDSSEPVDEPDDASDLEDFDFVEDDDVDWDVFIPDDDEYDLEPDLRDFGYDDFPNDE